MSAPVPMLGASPVSMPIAGPLYPPPPYEFRGARQTWVVYEADPTGLAAYLPEGVEPDSDPAVCAAWACHYPTSTFGPYLEAYLVVRVRVGEERFWYQPVIVTDSEAPMAAGRELWGYGKKLAHLTWSGRGSGGPGTEQLAMTVERPRGVRLMTLTMQPERLLPPEELLSLETAELLPTLSHRLLPASEPGRPPVVDELVAVDVRARSHRGADGRLELWRGRGAVELGSASAADPWHVFAPVRVLDAFTSTTDFTLPLGRVVPRP
ncbi:acetoacetate decarboxylase family protein [Nocardioides deserti]|uniref:Acetoacetate decarboxylase family protein n=1 Tax=Nocardioides deserti TaxID=1588644 RepID=A0ABR6U7L4_9ACTN|nr:acetoacetate decarboxylase family protein [Nocardioides deserti]MBC2960419.1 acetoacetate decarboxylase family protein [Nocardioides deserti]